MWGERESRIERVESRLDELIPVWQFGEFHAMEIAVSPARAYEAMKAVTAGEIFLFNTLTWIRRGGRRSPESILNAGSKDPLIDVATRSGFVRLADDFPRNHELSRRTDRNGRLARDDRDARARQQPPRAAGVRTLLESHLPGERVHSQDVAAGNQKEGDIR